MHDYDVHEVVKLMTYGTGVQALGCDEYKEIMGMFKKNALIALNMPFFSSIICM
jgi:hypothetical protein